MFKSIDSNCLFRLLEFTEIWQNKVVAIVSEKHKMWNIEIEFVQYIAQFWVFEIENKEIAKQL